MAQTYSQNHQTILRDDPSMAANPTLLAVILPCTYQSY